MKFQFCGGLDAPDFLLREIATLSKISSVKIKILCGQVASQLSGDGIKYEKVVKLLAGLDESDAKGVVAAMHFVLSNSAKYDLDGVALSSELQILGLPKEHADAFGRAYRDNKTKLQDEFRNTTLSHPHVVATSWRTDLTLSSSRLIDAVVPTVHFKLNLSNGNEHNFELSKSQFHLLHAELDKARIIMESAEKEYIG